MLKLILFSCLCLAFCTKTTNAGISTKMFFNDPAHPGKCTIQNKVLAPGESIKHPVLECAEFTCENAQGFGTIERCDPVHSLPSPLTLIKYDPKDPPHCTWGQFANTKAPYPECCKRNFLCIL